MKKQKFIKKTMMKKKIFIEKPFIYHLPLIAYHVFKGNEVAVFDINREIKKVTKKKWFIMLIRKKWLTRYHLWRDKHESLALDAVDAVYNYTLKKSSMVKSMIDCYGDNAIEMAYKKELCWELAIFYGMQLRLKREVEANPSGSQIVLYPYKYHTFLNLVKKCNCFFYDVPDISFSLWAILVSKFQQICINLKFYSLFIVSTFLLTIGIFMKKLVASEKNEKKIFKYAIPIRDPLFQFQFKGSRAFDFLLDHRRIKKDNTLFLSLSPMSNSKIKNLRSNGYNIVGCSNIFHAFNDISKNNTKGLVGVLAKYLFLNIPGSFLKQSCYLIANMRLLKTLIVWKVLLDKYELACFVSANDLGITHIGRNILLNKNNCKTWHYAHSGSLNYIFANKNLSFDNLREWLMSFLYYDYWALWNKTAIEYTKTHPLKIKEYFNIGCLWSELICESKIKRIDTYLRENNVKKQFNKGLKILSFFNTSYFEGDTSDVNLSDGIKFHKDIIRLLEEEENIFVLFKEKKPISHYVSFSYHKMYAELVREYASIHDELSSHPRCFMAGVEGDPSEIIAVSDITISQAFTSPTIDALCAKKKAFFHDPANRFKDYYYDKIPALVSHDYSELINKINSLFAITDEDYDKYLNRYVLNKIEDYLDGKALTRFRELICS